MHRKFGIELLVVEGEDDFFTIKNLLIRTGLLGKIRLEEGGGYERLRESISTRLDGSGLQRMGIVVDADESVANRWESLRAAAMESGYATLPVRPNLEGTIIFEKGRPTLGFWIMPDNRLPGELEDFVQMLIPHGDELWPRAFRAVEDIPVDKRRFGESVSKAQIHTWLAWQKEPGKPIGQAIVKKYFDTETPAALSFRMWLSRLFDVG